MILVSPGERFGRLTFIEMLAGRGDGKHRLARWKCDCGNTTEAAASRVKRGTPVSCGCFAREVSRAVNTTHGGRNTPEYSSWIAMVRRCCSPGDKDYPRYGAKGIGICALWRGSFEAFREDMGPRPSGTSIDRIDGKKGYEPTNCRWATRSQQQRNRRSSCVWHIKGEVFQSAQEAADHFSVSEQTVWRWVHGAFDARRNSHTPPRIDCHAETRY